MNDESTRNKCLSKYLEAFECNKDPQELSFDNMPTPLRVKSLCLSILILFQCFQNNLHLNPCLWLTCLLALEGIHEKGFRYFPNKVYYIKQLPEAQVTQAVSH